MTRAAAVFVLGQVLPACTAENLDESFLLTHGALLAKTVCTEGVSSSPVSGRHFHYEAMMFIDGSVLAFVTGDVAGISAYERSDVMRGHARLTGSAQYDAGCGGPHQYVEINGGKLELSECIGSPPAYRVIYSKTLSTDCAGFNQNLFN